MIGFLPVKFGLPRPFRSRVMLRHGTDGQTDTAAQSRMPPPYGSGGIIRLTIVNINIKIIKLNME